MMPARPGSELARVVGERAPRTVVILHSGRPLAELQALAEHVRAAGALSKGLSEAAFARELTRLLLRASRSTAVRTG